MAIGKNQNEDSGTEFTLLIDRKGALERVAQLEAAVKTCEIEREFYGVKGARAISKRAKELSKELDSYVDLQFYGLDKRNPRISELYNRINALFK